MIPSVRTTRSKPGQVMKGQSHTLIQLGWISPTNMQQVAFFGWTSALPFQAQLAQRDMEKAHRALERNRRLQRPVELPKVGGRERFAFRGPGLSTQTSI